MALTIETGAGVSGATSYASVDHLRAYALARGRTVPDADAKCEALLIRAMDRMRGLEYQGERYARDQALDFPRIDVYIDGFYFESTRLPPQLLDAQCALAIAAQTMELLPTTPANTAGPVISRTVGKISTQFANIGATRRTPIVTDAEALLEKLLQPGGCYATRV